MFIYTVKRAFRDDGNKLYEQGKEISKEIYDTLGDNQAFIKKIFSGTQAELDAILEKEAQEKTQNKSEGNPIELNSEGQEQLIAEKETLVKEYTDLFGEEPDKRWSIDTLKQKIEEKLSE